MPPSWSGGVAGGGACAGGASLPGEAGESVTRRPSVSWRNWPGWEFGFLRLSPTPMSFRRLRGLGTAWLTSAGVAAVVVGLAAQNTLGNLIAGVSLVLYRPFHLGDHLQVSVPRRYWKPASSRASVSATPFARGGRAAAGHSQQPHGQPEPSSTSPCPDNPSRARSPSPWITMPMWTRPAKSSWRSPAAAPTPSAHPLAASPTYPARVSP